MKVLYTSDGMPYYLNVTPNKLHEKGVEIAIVTPRKGSATIDKGVEMVKGGTYRHLTSTEEKTFYGKSVHPVLPEIVREERPNILIVGWPYFLQVFFQPGLREAMKECRTRLMIREVPSQTPPYGRVKEYSRKSPMYDRNMRLVSTGTGFYLKRWLATRIRKYCYAYATGVLSYSTTAYDTPPSYGVKREQTHVIYNSINTELLLEGKEAVLASALFLPYSAKHALHIGRLVKRKRVDLLIDAFPKVIANHSDVELVIVGSGPELDNLKKQAAERNLTDRTRFIGAVYNPKELGAYMNESTVYVLTGMGGLSIGDATTYGLPAVRSVCDSTERNLAMNGVNGLFFREGDADSLSDEPNELFAFPGRCAEMRRELKRIIREKISIETVSERCL